MLRQLLKLSLGLIIGAMLMKESKDASEVYDKAKKRIKELAKKLSFRKEAAPDNSA